MSSLQTRFKRKAAAQSPVLSPFFLSRFFIGFTLYWTLARLYLTISDLHVVADRHLSSVDTPRVGLLVQLRCRLRKTPLNALRDRDLRMRCAGPPTSRSG